jgi:hypothetical protein
MTASTVLRQAFAIGVLCTALLGATAPSQALTTTADGDPGTLPCMVKSQVKQHFRSQVQVTRVDVRDLGGSMFLVNLTQHFRYEVYFNGCTRTEEKRTRL